MPTTAELSKKILDLEARLNECPDNLVDAIFNKFIVKAQLSGVNFADINKQIGELVATAEYVNGVVESLQRDNASLIAENKALKAQNAALSLKVSQMEQYSRINNVEIKGIPVTGGENCVAIMQAIGDKIDCKLAPTDLDVVHRVSTVKAGAKNLLARFNSRTKKSEFLSKARKAKLHLNDIVLSGVTNKPIYINDHLTPENKALFSQALVLKKSNNWKFLWTDNCQIKARRTTESKVLRITCEADLSKIC
ncbi:uncharacterized protein LOC142786565 [Rhipicephalus microplus]|uniref:uncharacterized protein LOC142786565 n=1 Tax=Rhipicephalus microplus TaxID=6941 RepID=UPI003F6A6268